MTEPADNAPDLWRNLFPLPTRNSHKYSRGTVLVRGGAVMTGAARLAARAAQRMGAGLVTVAAPRSALPIYAEALESVIVRPADTLPEWQALIDDARGPSLLIGCGLGLGEDKKEEILAAVQSKNPCVLDADALTGFAGNAEKLFAHLHAACVLTPHEGEYARLFGVDSDTDKTIRALAAAKRAGCVILLKGAETVIASPTGRVVVNRNAPPWLATAGSGDVLAGMIVGLIAQGMDAFWAACAAAWIHGRVGTQHGAGLIAEDIVTGIPRVLNEMII